MKTLIVGFGNPDRQDDGVAWHILSRLSHRLGQDFPPSFEDWDGVLDGDPSFLFQYQLIPELAEVIADFDQVCFVDAHTGVHPNDISFIELIGTYTATPLTHHLTPETLLALINTLYKKTPKAVLVSVLGHQFGFFQSLSAETDRLADIAVDMIFRWLKHPHLMPNDPVSKE